MFFRAGRGGVRPLEHWYGPYSWTSEAMRLQNRFVTPHHPHRWPPLDTNSLPYKAASSHRTNTPFCSYLAHVTPHVQFQRREENRREFLGPAGSSPPSRRNSHGHGRSAGLGVFPLFLRMVLVLVVSLWVVKFTNQGDDPSLPFQFFHVDAPSPRENHPTTLMPPPPETPCVPHIIRWDALVASVVANASFRIHGSDRATNTTTRPVEMTSFEERRNSQEGDPQQIFDTISATPRRLR